MNEQPTGLDNLVRILESTGDYRVLRRLVPRTLSNPPVGSVGEKTGVIVDLETTGLDVNRDEIIEVAMLKFRYAGDGEITAASDFLQFFNEPSAPVPANITELTGITGEMVFGKKIDSAALESFVADASIIIAHNAEFDRQFSERYCGALRSKHWACSATDIDWRNHGFGGAKLTYLLNESGFFYDAHRALDDCFATLELLARRLPLTTSTALFAMLANARRKSFRIWAENSPFDFKDVLKRRGYRWNDGADGRPKSWYTDVKDSDALDGELLF